MQTQWWNPYGFEVNWYGYTMPMHEVTKNPPLACAYIALLSSIFGESEVALHLGFLAQAVAVVLGTYHLARRLCTTPFPATLAALFTPVIMVSSTTVMCDMLMLAFWIWAVVFWIKGLDDDQPLMLALAGLLVGAGVLAKYFGIALIPLLLAYSLGRQRRFGWWLAYLLIPVAVVLLYEYWTRALYGRGLLLDAFSYTHQAEPRTLPGLLVKTLTGVGFAGGCYAITLILTLVLWTRRAWLWAGCVVLVAVLGLFIRSFASTATPGQFLIGCQWTLLLLGGSGLLLMPILDWRRNKNGESLLLLLWIFGTFLFCILNWTINARALLPMAPAVAILLLRRIEAVAPAARLQWFFLPAALLALLVSFADYKLANSARAAAVTIKEKFGANPGGTVWFQGHWGFQYYAEANGLRAYDSTRSQLQPGDLMVLPFNNTNLIPIPKEKAERLTILEFPVFPWLSTTSKPVGSGFYMDILGPLPFAFGAVPPEKYYILRCK
ncbi:MAG: glycosyltransferase family 39 protein [Verrucomicrobiota bacterium]|nr:glycosyltransferase family 39 protein [Verrucomicrobiota bacterium]